MTERELMIECIPQITEMALEIKKMTAEQYQEFKKEHLKEVERTCPVTLGFMKKIYAILEWSLPVQGCIMIRLAMACIWYIIHKDVVLY